MKELKLCITLAIILFILSMFLSGCSIGIKPKSYDVPPDNLYYSQDTSYGSYSSYSKSSAYYYSDPNYSPWTMGTYYQNYSGPPKTYGVPGGSSSYIDSGKRSDSGSSVSASQSQAPTSSKMDRSSIRNRSNITPVPSDTSMTSQKIRSEISRERQNSQTDEEIENRRLKSHIISSQDDPSETQDENK